MQKTTYRTVGAVYCHVGVVYCRDAAEYYTVVVVLKF